MTPTSTPARRVRAKARSTGTAVSAASAATTAAPAIGEGPAPDHHGAAVRRRKSAQLVAGSRKVWLYLATADAE